jgi:serine/threonine protein kinase
MQKSAYLDTEILVANLLSSIDPDQQYTVYAKQSCNVNPNNLVEHEANFRKCRVSNPGAKNEGPFNPFFTDTLVEHAGNYSLLQIPFGGVDLVSFMNTLPSDLAPMLEAITPVLQTGIPNLLRGLRHLHAAGFYHMDIKPENVVFDGTRIRYIDYDLSATKATVAGRFPRYDPAYFIFPLEMCYTNLKPEEFETLSDDEVHRRLEAFYRRTAANDRIPTDLYWNKEGMPKFDVAKVRANILPLIRQRISAGDYAYLAEKADVYQLGLLMYTFVTYIFGITIHRGRIFEWSVMNKAWVPLGNSTGEQLEKMNALSAFLIPYIDICYGMMNVDVERRLSLDAALAAYDRMLEGFVSYRASRSLVGEKRPRSNNTEAVEEPPTKRQKTRRARRRRGRKN